MQGSKNINFFNKGERMKSVEQEIIYELNEYGNNFKMAKNKYSRFDAYNDKFIVEIKYRNKCYDSVLIEFDKYAYNLLYAKQFGKQFLYIVKMEQVIYVFNVTKLDKRGYYFKWKWLEMPEKTEFNGNKKMQKYVGFIYRWDDTQRYKSLINEKK